jgi:hypothetical protein
MQDHRQTCTYRQRRLARANKQQECENGHKRVGSIPNILPPDFAGGGIQQIGRPGSSISVGTEASSRQSLGTGLTQLPVFFFTRAARTVPDESGWTATTRASGQCPLGEVGSTTMTTSSTLRFEFGMAIRDAPGDTDVLNEPSPLEKIRQRLHVPPSFPAVKV